MKKFNEFINENITDILKGKSDDEVIKELEKLDGDDKIQEIIELQSYWEFLPRNKMGICHFLGDLILNGDEVDESQQIQVLPPDFVVMGDLDVSYNELRRLPINLRVKGDLDCTSNQLTEIPKDLMVGGNLYLQYNYIEELPESISVSGAIDCSLQDLVPKRRIKKPENFIGDFFN